MADNVAITAGSGTSIAADELTDATLGSCKVQFVKLMDGTLDSTNKAVVDATGAVKTAWASPTGASSQQVQGAAADNAAVAGNPVWVAGDDGAGNARSMRTDAAGFQVTKNFSSEVARTLICIYCDDITGSTSEALLSCNVNKAGSVTSAQTSYTVTANKTLRIIGFSAYIKGTTTTAAGAKVRIRQAASSIAASSPVIASLGVGMPAAVATASNGNNAQYEPGIEVAAGQQVALSQLATSTSSSVSACLVGFEY